MSKSDENITKRKLFEIYIIPHKLYADAMKKVDDCIDASQVSADPSSCLITGLSGTGKSTVCMDIEKKVNKLYPPAIEIGNDSVKKLIPIFNSSLGSGVNIKGVAKQMVIELGGQDASGDLTDLTIRLYALLKTCETKLIVLDEFHHLLQRGAEKTKEQVCDWVKNLMNKTKIPVIIVGTPDCEEIIDAHSQLSRRYCYRTELKPFEFNLDSRSDYIKVLKSLDKAFNEITGVSIIPKLYDEEMALAFYVATGGLMDSIRKLLAHTLRVSLDNDMVSVGKPEFSQAYKVLCLEGDIAYNSKVDPFNLPIGDLYGILNKALTTKKTQGSKFQKEKC